MQGSRDPRLAVSPEPAPRNQQILNLLRAKHPPGDRAQKAKASQRALNRIRQSDMKREIQQGEHPFESSMTMLAIKHATPNSAAGPSDLTFSRP